MTQQTLIHSDRSFVPTDTPMFAQLIQRLAVDENLSKTRRRDLISGLRRVAKAIGLPPEDVPCSGRWLQPRLAKINPVSIGLATKAWQNAVSDARAAMASIGVVERRFRRITDLTPEWRALWAAVLETKDRTLPPALCRFVHFLSRHGIAPDSVREEHAHAYREALIRNEISKSPDVAYRAAVNGWNLAVRRIPAWPRKVLPLTSRQIVFTLPQTAFPASFQQAVEGLMAKLGATDPLSDDGRSRPLRPITILQYRRRLIRFASELAHSGVLPEEIISLDFLVDPVMAERGLRQMLSRKDNKTTQMIAEVSSLLRSVGKIIGIPHSAQERLIKLAKLLAVKPQRGITRKNRARLRVLQDEKHQHRLLLLPERIFARPRGKTKFFTMALAREDALAIAILLVCPIRVKNLAGIHLGRHLHRPGDGRVFLVLDEDEVKNEHPLEFELPRDVIRMIDRHLVTRAPELCPPGTPWLFPRRDGQAAVDIGQLSCRISKRIRRETGLEMNAHLFRHFAVMNWLDANPGSYEVARRLLGHSELSHTINVYSGMEAKTATRAFADLMDTKKGRRK